MGCRDQGLWPGSGPLKQHMQRQVGELPPLQPPAAPVAPPSPVHRPAKLLKKEEPHSAPGPPAAVIGRPMQPGGPLALAPQAPRAGGLQLGQFMAALPPQVLLPHPRAASCTLQLCIVVFDSVCWTMA